ncbi:hypothetical protein MY04_1865 [Flammeovirga sp. MY04]|uniref:lysylphosphatidylglycerol synthase domain-containing protein n=1 Tax=Flammeovirga sp. MY04 TaxID=1191459 RepID=UPI0008062824|nr:lysylphosphatidylglycerol synthase domain-containing protein [Flammeovirga sp. MY04]ANQ49239.1 hypothetical protein MY04_1865 [Flammeovirga sp. MY04]
MKKYLSLLLKVIGGILFAFALHKFFVLSPWEKVQFEHPIYILFAFLLMPINWSLEALKWKKLISPKWQISFKEALLGVFSGVGGSLIAGRAVGSIMGRYWSLPKEEDRSKIIAPVLLGQWIQGIFTYLFGGISILMLGIHQINVVQLKYEYLFLIAFIILLVGIVLFFVIKTPSIQKKLINQLELIRQYDINILASITLCSGLRYFIFTLQFVIILYTFSEGEAWWIYFQWVSIIYLIKTLTPVMNMMMDIGARELSAYYIFLHYGADTNIALMSSLIVWGINILIPSLVGLTVRWRL